MLVTWQDDDDDDDDDDDINIYIYIKGIRLAHLTVIFKKSVQYSETISEPK